MKKKGPSLGHVQVDYRLESIFHRAVKAFQEADEAREKIEKEYEMKDKAAELLPRFFGLQEQRTEAGVVLLMAAGAYLEQLINDYAHTFLDEVSYKKHLDNLRTVTKWLLLPRLCQNKEIPDDCKAINDFREFVKARNAVVHHKRRDFCSDLQRASKETSTESTRFLTACRKAESTVAAMLEILSSSPTGKRIAKEA